MTLESTGRLAEKEVEIDHLKKHEHEMAEKGIQIADRYAKIIALEDENSRLNGMPQKKTHADHGKNTLQKPDKQTEYNSPISLRIKLLKNTISQLRV
ncbi:MAG: hypothetical protein F4X71_02335 [Cenarchaeum sp. SB0662_bin_33]|nr:hypothetical protein [Cenarchaeum sp. SB0662_bin_33]